MVTPQFYYIKKKKKKKKKKRKKKYFRFKYLSPFFDSQWKRHAISTNKPSIGAVAFEIVPILPIKSYSSNITLPNFDFTSRMDVTS